MSAILVTPPELRKMADQLRTRAKKIDAAMQAIDKELLSLKGDRFLGNRANTVQSHYAPRRDALLKASNIIVYFAGDLQTAADRFEQADRGGDATAPQSPDPGPVAHTMAIPEEGQGPVLGPGLGKLTLETGEDGVIHTMAIPEEGMGPGLGKLTLDSGEDGIRYTMAIPEEGQGIGIGTVTAFSGEDGSIHTMAIPEEGMGPGLGKLTLDSGEDGSIHSMSTSETGESPGLIGTFTRLGSEEGQKTDPDLPQAPGSPEELPRETTSPMGEDGQQSPGLPGGMGSSSVGSPAAAVASALGGKGESLAGGLGKGASVPAAQPHTVTRASGKGQHLAAGSQKDHRTTAKLSREKGHLAGGVSKVASGHDQQAPEMATRPAGEEGQDDQQA